MSIAQLEKPALLQIILLIHRNGENETLSTDLIENVQGSSHTVYSAISRLLENQLVQEKWKIKPRRRTFSLTKKGKEIAAHLEEMGGILASEDKPV